MAVLVGQSPHSEAVGPAHEPDVLIGSFGDAQTLNKLFDRLNETSPIKAVFPLELLDHVFGLLVLGFEAV